MNTNLGLSYYKKYFNIDFKNWSAIAEENDHYLIEANKVYTEAELSSYQAEILKYNNLTNNVGGSQFELQTIYPGLLVGSGIHHQLNLKGEYKFGLEFDHITGLPYIPGSAIKGVIKNALTNELTTEQNETLLGIQYFLAINTETKINGFDQLGVEGFKSLLRLLFEPDKESEIPQYDIFFDAFISSDSGLFIGDDAITPHKDDNLQNPIPLAFIKVLPGIQFKFQFKFNTTYISDGLAITPADKLKLYSYLIQIYGVGAKTNFGYGRFVEAGYKPTSKQFVTDSIEKKQSPSSQNVPLAIHSKLKKGLEFKATVSDKDTLFYYFKFEVSGHTVLLRKRLEIVNPVTGNLEQNAKVIIRFNTDYDPQNPNFKVLKAN
jgi:CRISPR-associated protein Cmr6